jgi:hypothetical protein
MFKQFLKKDLQALFETESVDFANGVGNFGSELGCLLVVLDQDGIKSNFRDGESYFSVVGTLEYVQDQTQTKFGFFNERIFLSKFETKGKFKLLDRESNEAIANDPNNDAMRLLVKKSQKFNYRISIPFNPPIGDIESVEFQTSLT